MTNIEGDCKKMDQNRDWKPMAALVLAGLALFVALSGGRGGRFEVQAPPQQIIVQPAAPAAPAAPAQPGGGTIVLPAVPQQPQMWDDGHGRWGNGHGFPLFVPLFF